MDSSLLREREKFRKKAISNPVVEKRKSSTNLDNQKDHKKQKKGDSELKKTVNKPKKHHNFRLLTKIVQHMRKKYLEGNKDSLTLEKILQEINQSEIDPKVKSWLDNESLKGNPKIQVIDGKFLFKPIYKLTDRLSLLNLLKRNDVKGLGGVLWEDVVDSLPKAEHILKELLDHNKVKIVTNSVDKKKILFRMDPTANLNIDEDFKTLWNTVDVEALDDRKMCEYLNKQGLTSMKGEGFKRPMTSKNNQKDGTRKGKPKKNKDNLHLEGVLETYDGTLSIKAS